MSSDNILYDVGRGINQIIIIKLINNHNDQFIVAPRFSPDSSKQQLVVNLRPRSSRASALDWIWNDLKFETYETYDMCFQLFQMFIFGFAWNIFRFERKRCSEKQVLDTGIHSLQYRTSTRTKQICMSSNLRSTLISVSKSWGQIQHIAVSENMKQ